MNHTPWERAPKVEPVVPVEIRLEFGVALSAGVADAFAAVTEAAQLVRWFCDEADVEPGMGGALRLLWSRPEASPEPFRGRWVEWDPPRLAAYEGGHSGYPGGHAGRIRCELTASPQGARLAVTHILPNRDEYLPVAERYREAWPRALARLARCFELRGGTE